MKRLTMIFFLAVGLFQFGFSQTSTPNSFLDFKLGTKLTDFLTNNTDAKEGSFWVLHTDISAKGMTVYTVHRTTSSGDKVQIDCCFYNDILSIISVEYSGWQSGKDLLDALKSKYGAYTSYDAYEWKDFMNGQYRTTETVYWKKTTCILNFLYTKELGIAELVFADKAVQQKLEAEKQNSNSKKIE